MACAALALLSERRCWSKLSVGNLLRLECFRTYCSIIIINIKILISAIRDSSDTCTVNKKIYGKICVFQVCHIFFPGLPFPRGVSEGCCFLQPAVLKAYTLEPHSVGRTPGGWWFSTGSGPASTVPHGRSGAACRCWLGTWPHDPAVGQHACAG